MGPVYHSISLPSTTSRHPRSPLTHGKASIGCCCTDAQARVNQAPAFASNPRRAQVQPASLPPRLRVAWLLLPLPPRLLPPHFTDAPCSPPSLAGALGCGCGRRSQVSEGWSGGRGALRLLSPPPRPLPAAAASFTRRDAAPPESSNPETSRFASPGGAPSEAHGRSFGDSKVRGARVAHQGGRGTNRSSRGSSGRGHFAVGMTDSFILFKFSYLRKAWFGGGGNDRSSLPSLLASSKGAGAGSRRGGRRLGGEAGVRRRERAGGLSCGSSQWGGELRRAVGQPEREGGTGSGVKMAGQRSRQVVC